MNARTVGNVIVAILGTWLVVFLIVIALLVSVPPIRAVDPSPLATPCNYPGPPLFCPRTTLIPPVTTTPQPTP